MPKTNKKATIALVQSSPTPPLEIIISNDDELESIQLEYNCSSERIGSLVKAITRRHVHLGTPSVLIRIARTMLTSKNMSYERIPSQLANQTKLELRAKEFYRVLRSYHESEEWLVVKFIHDPSPSERPSEGKRAVGVNSFIEKVAEKIRFHEEQGDKVYSMDRGEVPRTYAGNPSSLVYNLRRYKKIETKFTQTKTKIKLHW